jgi:hypothetical protein
MAKTKEQFNIQRSQQQKQPSKKGENKWWIKP